MKAFEAIVIIGVNEEHTIESEGTSEVYLTLSSTPLSEWKVCFVSKWNTTYFFSKKKHVLFKNSFLVIQKCPSSLIQDNLDNLRLCARETNIAIENRINETRNANENENKTKQKKRDDLKRALRRIK